LKPLLAALNDPDTDVREAAAEALGWKGNADAVEPLVAALRAQQVGIYAVEALGKIKDQRAVEGLILVLGQDDIEAAYAARALGELRDQRAVAPLVNVLKNSHAPYTRAAAQTLGAAAEALAKLGAVEPLITALTETNERVRGSAAAALKESKDPRAISSLLAALERRDILVVAQAFRFFVLRGEPNSEDTLVEALKKYGDTLMANDLLNCGNPKLKAAAEEWANAHGHQIVSLGLGGGGPRWGEKH
jgi:HEAT repeat protein